MQFFTIGVYNSSEAEYFNKLSSHGINVFCDIRQRRGVRGSRYAFVNSKRLQKKLEELRIHYIHIKDLAPTKEIRELQKEADKMTGQEKRTRNKLGMVFTSEYRSQILNTFDFNDFLFQLKEMGAEKVVLFCVEENAEACHRSLVAKSLVNMGYELKHI